MSFDRSQQVVRVQLYSILYNATTLTNAVHSKYIHMRLSVILCCCFFYSCIFFSHNFYKRKSDAAAIVVSCSSSKKKVLLYSLHEYIRC